MRQSSIIDIISPVMAGPSSSHTAGAVRLGLLARNVYNAKPDKITFKLYNSYALTGKGHGTDKGLLAGILGFSVDDVRIKNVFETEKEYKVELAAPGMTKEDFNVHIDEENNLVISMEKKTENKEESNKDEKKEGRYLRREFSYSKFQQTMILPDDVDKEKISAQVENGVLNINLPKFTEQEKEKTKKFIDVK